VYTLDCEEPVKCSSCPETIIIQREASKTPVRPSDEIRSARVPPTRSTVTPRRIPLRILGVVEKTMYAPISTGL
ncbi:hypothetical protein, partial [Micrococcus sp. HMSC067E09]|uniref:hypothetical protein n=1 Tax=Micrococcus sp. HMSC067E09 TaxID=1739367 RepID=UPI001AEF6715